MKIGGICQQVVGARLLNLNWGQVGIWILMLTFSCDIGVQVAILTLYVVSFLQKIICLDGCLFSLHSPAKTYTWLFLYLYHIVHSIFA